ncbi:MAG: sensor histidine kinase [Vicinamibacteraceae bacterium]
MVGYLTGAALYAMLLAMVWRARASTDRLVLATALLGLVWNIGELLIHATGAIGYDAAAPWLAAMAYTALGLLAAVVVHSVSRLQPNPHASRRRLVQVAVCLAYGSAAAAGLLHLDAAATAAHLPSPTGLDVMTGGLLALSVPLVITTRGQDHARRALWMSALAVFAVSALHLARFHGANESWAVELIGHHASIPLAFAMLYRDYRFALADLFLKQALTLLVLVVLVLAGYSALEARLAPSTSGVVVLLIGTWIATVLLFPWLRRAVSWFVDRVVLSRSNYAELLDEMTTAVQACDDTDEVLASACARLAPALSAASVTFKGRALETSISPPAEGVVVPTTEPPHYVLSVGPLAGGRRLLSDDLRMLERAAAIVGRRIDALRLTKERYERMLQEREIRALATEAELRALRAQINPHFLFNALTTIGFLIQCAPPRATDTLMRLATLLRAVLRSEGEFTSLGRERELIECYLQIERERFEERLFRHDRHPTRAGRGAHPFAHRPASRGECNQAWHRPDVRRGKCDRNRSTRRSRHRAGAECDGP